MFLSKLIETAKRISYLTVVYRWLILILFMKQSPWWINRLFFPRIESTCVTLTTIFSSRIYLELRNPQKFAYLFFFKRIIHFFKVFVFIKRVKWWMRLKFYQTLLCFCQFRYARSNFTDCCILNIFGIYLIALKMFFKVLQGIWEVIIKMC